jgi:hypothetical protein
VKDPVLQNIFGLGGNPDGLGTEAPARAPASTDVPNGTPNRPINPRPGTGLEHTALYTLRRGMGAVDGESLAASIFRMVLMGAAGTVTGMAMAPSHDKRTKYAITGGLLGFFLGPLGIGGQAVYVLSKE